MKKYLVGGAVRDDILRIPVTEKDWVVVGATPQDLLNQGYHKVGKDFPVFLHPENSEEYALARTERKSSKGYTGFICFYSPEVTLEDDLRRRDLTINAIARDEQGNLIDPYQGQQDIKKRWLRHVSESFEEDPLRILRVARFAARFAHLNFRIAPETMLLMRRMVSELPMLTPERVWKETKQALASNNPHIYFQVLRECDALKVVFPEINNLFGVLISTNWHKRIDAGVHTLKTLSMAALLSNDIAVRFAVLCQDLDKTLTPRNLCPNYDNRQLNGLKIVMQLCQRLKVPNSIRDVAKITTQYCNLLFNIKTLTPSTLVKLLNDIDVWRRPKRLEQIVLVSKASALAHNYPNSNMIYPQGDFLQEAYHVANSIKVQDIIQSGFSGIDIKQEIAVRRQQALTIWKTRKSTKN